MTKGLVNSYACIQKSSGPQGIYAKPCKNAAFYLTQEYVSLSPYLEEVTIVQCRGVKPYIYLLDVFRRQKAKPKEFYDSDSLEFQFVRAVHDH